MTESIDALRALVPVPPDRFDLNAGTLSPTPLPTSDALSALRHIQTTDPSHFFFQLCGPALARARTSLATWLGVEGKDLFLLPNVTHALNLVLLSIDLSPGDEILTTSHEYGAMRILLDRIATRSGASVVVADVPLTDATHASVVEAFTAKLTRQTRLVFFSHVASATGLRFPAQDIVSAVRSAAPACLTVIDGAHGPGMIPIDLAAINADAYAANIHKWMMGPCSSGFLHVRPRIKHRLRPLLHSWGDDYAAQHDAQDPRYPDEVMADPYTPQCGATRLQYRLEYAGVVDRTPQMVLPSVIEFLDRVGQTRRESCWRTLSDHTQLALSRIGLRCASPTDPTLTSAMPVFDIADDASLPHRLWERQGVFVPVTRLGSRSLLRVSTAWFNTPEQIDRLARALQAEQVQQA